MKRFCLVLSALISIRAICLASVPVSESKDDFRKAVVTAETNRRATVDAVKLIDRDKPDCGIQEAIDSLPPQGGAVILPKGEFILHRPLFLRSGVALRGQGSDTKLALPSPIPVSPLLERPKQGDLSVKVEDATRFKPGWILCITRDSSVGHLDQGLREERPCYVKTAEGQTLELTHPYVQRKLLPGDAAKEHKAQYVAANFFPVIQAYHVSHVEVRDLEIVGRIEDPAKIDGGYFLGGINFYDAVDSRICNVTVRGWKGDAFSLQCGGNNLVVDCRAIGALGKGLHPGSEQAETIMSRCVADSCGGDGFFFCREDTFCVMGNHTLVNNGIMIGGLPANDDEFNVANRNLGINNRQGVWFGPGENAVFSGNVVVNAKEAPSLEFNRPKGNKPPPGKEPTRGPTKYVVATRNTFINDATNNNPAPIVLVRAETAGCVIANNAYSNSDPAGAFKDETGGENVVLNNKEGSTSWEKPVVPRAPAPLPEKIIDAASAYDPALPDCGFQQVLDKAAGAGGMVRLPAGWYSITKSLTIPSHVTLCGEGVATVFVWEGSGAAITSEGTIDVAVRRLILRHGKGNQNSSSGIRFKNVREGLIEGVVVEGFHGAGIAMSQVDDVLISQSTARGCETGYDVADAENLDLAESWGRENREDGLKLTRPGQRVTIDSSIFSANQRCGIAAQAAQANQLLIISSVIEKSGENGILLEDCVGTTIQGNVVHGSSARKAGSFAGVLLSGGTRQTKVIENRISNQRTRQTPDISVSGLSVEEAAFADENVVQYNVLCTFGYTGETIAMKGKKSVAENNVLTPQSKSHHRGGHGKW